MSTVHEFEFNNKVYLIEEDDDGDFFILGDDSRCYSSLESAQYRIDLTESEKLLFQKCLDLGVKFFRHYWNDSAKTIDDLLEENYFYFRFAFIPSFEAGKAIREFLENEIELYYDCDMEDVLELIPSTENIRWDSSKFPCAVSDTKIKDCNFILISSDDFYHIKSIIVDNLFR